MQKIVLLIGAFHHFNYILHIIEFPYFWVTFLASFLPSTEFKLIKKTFDNIFWKAALQVQKYENGFYEAFLFNKVRLGGKYAVSHYRPELIDLEKSNLKK